MSSNIPEDQLQQEVYTIRVEDNLEKGNDKIALIEKEEQEDNTTINEESNNLYKRNSLLLFFNLLKKYWKVELLEIFYLTWPILVSSVCSSFLGTTDMAFVGRLGKDYLASASLGNAIFNSLSFIPIGFLGAQDTLISQADGAKNERMKRIVLYRSIFVVTLVLIPFFVLFLFSEHILLLIGQEKQIASLTARFIQLNSIGLWPFCMMRLLNRYLTAQRRVYFPMVTSICSVFINALMNYLLIFKLGFGFNGAPLATSITRLFIMLALTIYTIYVQRQKRIQLNELEEEQNEKFGILGKLLSIIKKIKWLLWNILQPKGIYEFIKMGIPASAAACFDVWGFYISTLFVASLKNNAYTSAHSIVLNVCVITYMLPFSCSIASSIRIGISLGAKEADKAKVDTFFGFCIATLFMIINAIVVFAARFQIGRIFTDDSEVIEIVASLLPVAVMYQIFDGSQVSLTGILRGTGRQMIGAVANFIAYYIIGLPLAALLCFYVKWSVKGVWIGMLAGVFAVSLMLLLYVIFLVNFEQEVQKALDRISRSDIELPDTQQEDIVVPVEEEEEEEQEANDMLEKE